jgi:hypothetical protein
MYSENNTDPFRIDGPTLLAQDLPLIKRAPYFARKSFRFLWRYRNQLPYLLTYLRFIAQGSYKEKACFMDDETFIEEAKVRSTLRLQDGEFTLLLGTRDVSYEQKNERIINMWKEAITTYSDESSYILGLPPYILIDNFTLHKYGFKYLWIPAKILYRMLFPKKPAYFNGSYFYINGTSIPFMQALSKESDVLLISNRNVIEATKPHTEHFFQKAYSVSYIETPEKNASTHYDEIMKQIEQKCTPRTVIFMACGPAGKAMIYDLSKKNILAHDIGYGLTGAYTGEEREHFLKWDTFGPIYHTERIRYQK